ncbi:hypothetical protein [Streptomyces sp. NPDC047525]|uniref:hypothetical protein n=1 Tax=Streptomyces sp. NPDC047525 TaxID=3155264 RepID=UPI0033E171EB
MQIGKRKPFLSGIQASQIFETHDRVINGTRYRFVAYIGHALYAQKPGAPLFGVTVSRVIGEDQGGYPILEKVHTFGAPMSRWGAWS